MVQLIIGNKGKGKTKFLLEKVNSEIKGILGNICYLDKSSKHMFELNNKVRLINVSDFNIENTDQFIGFISGIISQDHDIQEIYIDGFEKLAQLPSDLCGLEECLTLLVELGEIFNVKFTVGVSAEKEQLSPALQDMVTLAL